MNIALCAQVRSFCTSRKRHGRHIDFRMGCRTEKTQTIMRPKLIPTRLPSPKFWRCFLAQFSRRHNIPRPTANNSIKLNLCVSSSSLFFFYLSFCFALAEWSEDFLFQQTLAFGPAVIRSTKADQCVV